MTQLNETNKTRRGPGQSTPQARFEELVARHGESTGLGELGLSGARRVVIGTAEQVSAAAAAVSGAVGKLGQPALSPTVKAQLSRLLRGNEVYVAQSLARCLEAPEGAAVAQATRATPEAVRRLCQLSDAATGMVVSAGAVERASSAGRALVGGTMAGVRERVRGEVFRRLADPARPIGDRAQLFTRFSPVLIKEMELDRRALDTRQKNTAALEPLSSEARERERNAQALEAMYAVRSGERPVSEDLLREIADYFHARGATPRAEDRAPEDRTLSR